MISTQAVPEIPRISVLKLSKEIQLGAKFPSWALHKKDREISAIRSDSISLTYQKGIKKFPQSPSYVEYFVWRLLSLHGSSLPCLL